MADHKVNSIADVLKTGKFADFQVVCGPITFHVNKLMLAINSEFFGAMFRNSCKADSCHPFQSPSPSTDKNQETIEGMVDLPDDDPFVIGQMLAYMYKDRYTLAEPEVNYTLSPQSTSAKVSAIDSMKSREKSNNKFRHSVDMYLVGEKYGIHGMKSLAQWEALSWLDNAYNQKPYLWEIKENVDAMELLLTGALPESEFRVLTVQKWVAKQDPFKRDVMAAVVRKYEPVAFMVGELQQRCIKSLRERNAGLSAEIVELYEKLPEHLRDEED